MSLTRYQATELVRCEQDVVYFIRNYGWMRHPTLGAIPFIPWDWQESLLRLWQAGYSTNTLKSRQQGFSWTAMGYIAHVVLFSTELDILLLSSKEEKAIKLLKKLTFLFERLPGWMKPRVATATKTQFSLLMRYYDEAREQWVLGDGTVSSLTTTGTTGAGEAARLVFVDEFALMTERGNDEEVWAAIAPTTTHGGQLITGSTPRGSTGQFYHNWNAVIEPLMDRGIINDEMSPREWNRAVLQHAHELEVIPTVAHYSMCYHDEEWIAASCARLGERKAERIRRHFTGWKYDAEWRKKEARKQNLTKAKEMQEFELVFDSPGNAAFNSSDINACYLNPELFPWVKKLIADSNFFYIGVDTAEGVTIRNQEPDFNSICVLNQHGVQVYGLENRENIDDWAGKTIIDPASGEPKEIEGTVLRVIRMFRPSFVIVEKNGPGVAVINRIHTLLPDDVELRELSMTGAAKPQLVADLQLEMSDEQRWIKDGETRVFRSIILTHFFTTLCLRQYVKMAPGKFQANVGFYDDPVVSLLWASYARRIKGAYNFAAAAISSGQRIIGTEEREDLPRGRLEQEPVGERVVSPPALSQEVLDSLAGVPSALGGNGRSLSGGRRSLTHYDESRRRFHGR